ncbi:YeeE/YedE family protein [Psychromarinibacter sp. C21-152]|uniref:YeeE/YedE family protein n=1 Tax=Psychromarinibacter sediminicola TaxID=3033385 RepID=A0AAE3T761_9RHOB|nr:YeeE/YedE family protein [Psychromarinibacter sediminicola]MDF0600005.1 YeeE/YedE family protein [Psychromarinibacter sediminicola]
MLETLIDSYGEPALLGGLGVLVGLLFGAAAQHSRFCLRAATIEVSEHRLGERMAVWLLAFFSALSVTQLAIRSGVLDVTGSRQLAATGSLSGAILGGLMFGAGMILARGCASRLLVLSGTGNMRALVTGLVVTLVAQASYTGILAPAREALATLWTVPGGAARDLGQILGLGPRVPLVFGLFGLAGAFALAFHRRIGATRWIAAMLVGVAVALGWIGTYAIAAVSFEVIPISSVTFTGPSTDTLMALVAERSVVLSFGIGLVPGVFVGSAATALLAREWKIERFGPDTPMERYMLGAVLMGFGAMLAGGCAVGAGVSGGAILSLTAWVAVASMWAGALIMQLLIARRGPVAVTP